MIAMDRIERDQDYSSAVAQQLDLGWQLFHRGYIQRNPQSGLDIWKKEIIPIHDEYVFIRKNYHAIWSLFVLSLRLLSFHNPVKELAGWWKARKIKRVAYASKSYAYPEYQTFQGKLLASMPFVSIVIPTLNRYPYLKDVLLDLEKQTYRQFEVIVVDQSEPFQEDVYSGWSFPLRVWHQQEKALWKARNDAVNASKGNLLLLYDDDSRVASDWIEHHVRTLDYFNADISSGVSISTVGAKVPAHYSYFRWSEQLDTGNVMIKRKVFEQIGLFDRQFEKQRMGDGEFGLRAYLAGFRNISNPYAKRIHLKVSEGGLRQMGSWDGWRPKKIFAPRPVPSVLYLYRKYFGNRAALRSMVVMLLPSIIPYRWKGRYELMFLLIPFLPILLPMVLVQGFLSWRLAGLKLAEGARIDKLI